MSKYYNLYEHIPEDEHSHISNKIWEAFERAGIKLSQDAELSIRVYDDEIIDDVVSEGNKPDLSKWAGIPNDYLDSQSEGYHKIPERY